MRIPEYVHDFFFISFTHKTKENHSCTIFFVRHKRTYTICSLLKRPAFFCCCCIGNSGKKFNRKRGDSTSKRDKIFSFVTHPLRF